MLTLLKSLEAAVRSCLFRNHIAWIECTQIVLLRDSCPVLYTSQVEVDELVERSAMQ